MRTRMVPVSTITDSLHRAVRDAARSLGKDVRWEVRGEDTELDRGVLHQLADSLLHLVRNAVDHGIDTPEERVARESRRRPSCGCTRCSSAPRSSSPSPTTVAASTSNECAQQAVRIGIDVDG